MIKTSTNYNADAGTINKFETKLKMQKPDSKIESVSENTQYLATQQIYHLLRKKLIKMV